MKQLPFLALHMSLEAKFNSILEGAVFIADAHYSKNRDGLYRALGTIMLMRPSQIFLMGDIFDFLSGDATYFKQTNTALIELINGIAQIVPVFYFEGNHDFNLTELFPAVKVYSRQEQPQIFMLANKKVALSHGDIFLDRGYDIFCMVVRHKFFVRFFNILDINFWISKKIENKLSKKHICKKIPLQKIICEKKVINYQHLGAELVLEGHFHQGDSLNIDKIEYLNIPAYACDATILIYKNGKFKKIKA